MLWHVYVLTYTQISVKKINIPFRAEHTTIVSSQPFDEFGILL